MSLIDLLLPGLLALILVLLVLIWVRQKPQVAVSPELLRESSERLERELRDELGRSGSATRQKRCQSEAPRLDATSSASAPMAPNALRNGCTMKGNE